MARVTLSLLCIFAFSLSTFAAEKTLLERIQTADPENGQRLFDQCLECHAFEPDGANGTGPNLWGIVEKKVASDHSYRYSIALSLVGGIWSLGRLDQFLASPSIFTPGTKMLYPGIQNGNDRADILAWLNTFDESPTGSNSSVMENENNQDQFGSGWPAGPGSEVTGYTCSTCHSLAIVSEQNLNRRDWSLVIGRMIKEQGLRVLSNSESEIMLDYLTKYFGANSN